MKSILSAMCILVLLSVPLSAQDAEQEPPTSAPFQSEVTEATNVEKETPADQPQGSEFEKTADDATQKAKDIAAGAADKAGELAVRIDQNEAAQEAAAGILQPIYLLAESLAFPAFYWLAFALMVSGTVNFAFQIVLGKLVVLTKGSINLKEILSDAISLIISVIGLVLTTQAATQNSIFTQSAAMVLSATVTGAVLGLVLYRWGQSLEVSAVTGQRVAKK